MKHSHLEQIAAYLKKFKKINAIHRVDDKVIKIAFDQDETLFLDMNSSESKIYKCDNFTRSKTYNAPFDVLLQKLCNRGSIDNIELLGGDKILRFSITLASSYKTQTTYLQFEFTGKHTNVILLDENETILEALRHVDGFTSFREVRVGQKLITPPPAPFVPKSYPIEDMQKHLREVFLHEQAGRLEILRTQKKAFLEKKLQKLQKLYAELDDEKLLACEMQELRHYGNLVLLNMQNLKTHQNSIILTDYDQTLHTVALPKRHASVSAIADDFFSRSKKAKQKLKNLHIERESLSSKITFLRHFLDTLEHAQDISQINLLFPKHPKGKKTKESESIESFYIEGHKVSLGKNEKGNIELLARARAKDIWLHMKDIPSAHVIITTDKQSLPHHIIAAAARLCVNFTMFEKDRYLVDYTPRREVKIQERANVLYYNYKTIEVDTRSESWQ